ncbi:MAG: YraN family protein [Actinomycetota bacterium]|nr:YraN family protein [Actinomycetota bacterium]
MRASQELGRYGEDLAAAHVRAAGMRILARNWRCSGGELDVVAVDTDGCVVFIEVKTRRSADFGTPVEAVTWQKARRIRRLALRWLAEHPQPGRRALRFDVISVVRPHGGGVTVHHLRAAF